MAIKLYPQEFSDISFDQVADEFYRKVFGISFKDVQ
jgi:iron complex transport system substrate-binding protein